MPKKKIDPYDPDQVFDYVQGLEERIAKLEEKTKRKSSPRFNPPTMEEAAAHHSEKRYTFNLISWYNHYETNGWMVGVRKMKNWQSSMVTWQQREPVHTTNNAGNWSM
jgi:hypothetical protein